MSNSDVRRRLLGPMVQSLEGALNVSRFKRFEHVLRMFIHYPMHVTTGI